MDRHIYAVPLRDFCRPRSQLGDLGFGQQAQLVHHARSVGIVTRRQRFPRRRVPFRHERIALDVEHTDVFDPVRDAGRISARRHILIQHVVHAVGNVRTVESHCLAAGTAAPPAPVVRIHVDVQADALAFASITIAVKVVKIRRADILPKTIVGHIGVDDDVPPQLRADLRNACFQHLLLHVGEYIRVVYHTRGVLIVVERKVFRVGRIPCRQSRALANPFNAGPVLDRLRAVVQIV